MWKEEFGAVKFTVFEGRSKVDELLLPYGTSSLLTENKIIEPALDVMKIAVSDQTRGKRYFCDFVHMPCDDKERLLPDKDKTPIKFSHRQNIKEFFSELENIWYSSLLIDAENGCLPDLDQVQAWLTTQRAKPMKDQFLQMQIHNAHVLLAWRKAMTLV